MPTVPETLHQALRHQQAGRLPQAEALYREVLAEDSENWDALHLLGVIACQTHRPAEAETLLRHALALQPALAEFHNSLGIVLRKLDRVDDAITSYERAIQLKPAYAEAHENLAIAYEKQSRLDEAIASYQKAVHLKPRSAKTHVALAALLKIRHRPDEAIPHYQTALAMDSSLPEAHNNLGNLLVDKFQAEQALPYFQKAVQLQPDRAEFQTNLGVALEKAGRTHEAVAAHEMALQLRPGFADAYCNLGAALEKLDRLEESIAAHRKAIALQPDSAAAHNNLGNALQHLGRVDEGVAAGERAIALQPDFAEAHMNLAVGLLLRGEFARGWDEYEWRWKCKGFARRQFQFSQPVWDGTEAQGKTLLLEAEQGLGDTLQFIRYAPLVAQRVSRLIVACPPEVKTIVEKVEGVAQVIWEGTKLPAFDLQATLLSLPRILGTTIETIPTDIPYLTADPKTIACWRLRLTPESPEFVKRSLQKLGKFGSSQSLEESSEPSALCPPPSALKIGLAWAGNPKHTHDRNRSLPLAAMAPLAQVENTTLFSLQKGAAAAQTGSAPQGFHLVDFTADLHDFGDTAALLTHLDLVITVDTAVAHLAGAMGKPVWTLLPYSPDWRWLLHREDSPWYPTMRLFRQPTPGDWASVILRVAQELSHFKR